MEGEFWPFKQYSVRWVARAVYLVSHPLVISISKCVWISLYFNLQLHVKLQDYFPSVWTFLFRRFILVQVCWWKIFTFSVSTITSSSFFNGIFTEYRISFGIFFSFIILNMSFHFCFHCFYQEVSSFISSFVDNTSVFLQLVLNVSFFPCFLPVCLSCTLLPFSLHIFFRDTWICEIVSFINMEKKNFSHSVFFSILLILSFWVSEWMNEWMCQSLSRVWLFATPWTAAHQAPLSTEFSRQTYWSGLPFPIPKGCIFLTQGLNLGLVHCGQILYHLSLSFWASSLQYSSNLISDLEIVSAKLPFFPLCIVIL